jgi:hypothetical protein
MNTQRVVEFFKSNGVMITLVLLFTIILFYVMTKKETFKSLPFFGKERMKDSSVDNTWDQDQYYDVTSSTIYSR